MIKCLVRGTLILVCGLVVVLAAGTAYLEMQMRQALRLAGEIKPRIETARGELKSLYDQLAHIRSTPPAEGAQPSAEQAGRLREIEAIEKGIQDARTAYSEAALQLNGLGLLPAPLAFLQPIAQKLFEPLPKAPVLPTEEEETPSAP